MNEKKKEMYVEATRMETRGAPFFYVRRPISEKFAVVDDVEWTERARKERERNGRGREGRRGVVWWTLSFWSIHKWLNVAYICIRFGRRII